MTIRPPALAVILGAAVMLAVVVYFYIAGERSRVAALEQTLTAFAAAPAFTEVRARCHADPAKLGPVIATDLGASFEVFAYDGEFHPADRDAPAFSVDLADRMRGTLSAMGPYQSADGGGVEMGIVTPWRDGPCALMLVRLASKR